MRHLVIGQFFRSNRRVTTVCHAIRFSIPHDHTSTRLMCISHRKSLNIRTKEAPPDQSHCNSLIHHLNRQQLFETQCTPSKGIFFFFLVGERIQKKRIKQLSVSLHPKHTTKHVHANASKPQSPTAPPLQHSWVKTLQVPRQGVSHQYPITTQFINHSDPFQS